MKNNFPISAFCLISITLLLTIVLTPLGTNVAAQSSPAPTDFSQRLARARALVASHKLAAAAVELDSIRKTATDESVLAVARILLIGVYTEIPDYAQAQNLLEELFDARLSQKESSLRAYFTVGAHAVRGARDNLNRYRSFGLNVMSSELPQEAAHDLARMRLFLDRIVDQTRALIEEDSKGTEAYALLEDVASVRVGISRSEKEQAYWQSETVKARQKLVEIEGRLTLGHTKIAQVLVASEVDSRSETEALDPPPSDVGPLKVGSLLNKATERVTPAYPQIARTVGVSGMVTVYFLVDEAGKVVDIERTYGHQLLRRAAEDAVRRWKFEPTTVNGQPVRVVGYLAFNFTL